MCMWGEGGGGRGVGGGEELLLSMTIVKISTQQSFLMVK